MMRRALSWLSCRVAAVGAVLGLAGAASGTWSIILVDTRTGEVAIGSATCLTNFDLQAGTPVLLTGIGGATAQSFVDNTGQNRTLIRDELLYGTPPREILELLSDFDPGHQTRQYGIADAFGGTATFSGTGAGDWKGGVTGRVGDIVYAIQGNVLTGEPVVLAAEEAVLETEGDLAAKLMASMEAARSFGGDGRCSCSVQDPEACGSPPPNFDKSAHIAYMLIARTGDTDICNASYRAGTQPWSVAAGDFDEDGRIDVAVADRAGEGVAVLLNESPDDFAAAIMSDATLYASGGDVEDIAAADLDGDGHLDLAYAITGADALGVRLGAGDGTFGSEATIALADEPERVDAVDVDQDGALDLVAVVPDASAIVIAYGDGDGGFGETQTVDGAGDPTSVGVADLDGDGDLDLAVGDKSLDVVLLFVNEGGEFSLADFVFVGENPEGVAAGDLDADGDVDLVVPNNSDATVTLLSKDDDALSYTETVFETWFGPARSRILDLDADGVLDIVVLHNPNRFTVLRGTGGGAFELEAVYPTLGSNTEMALADADGDGDADLISATAVPGTVYIVPNLGGGVFNDQLGCGAGDHFMEFNIAFQSLADPDPVFQLQDLFDQWREDLIGRPDAVRTTAGFEPESIPGDSESTSTLTVVPLDWQGEAAIGSVASASVAHAPGSAGLGTAEVVSVGPDAVTIEVTAGVKPGVDLFRVTLEDGVRPVVLMPDPSIEYSINVDFNGDGSLNVLDFVALQLAFQAGDEAADMNGDGELSVLDFVAFTEAFQNA